MKLKLVMAFAAALATSLPTTGMAQTFYDTMNEMKLHDLNSVAGARKQQLETLLGLSQSLPPSREGIPQPGDLEDSQDLIQSAYSTSSLIQKAIDEARSLSMGRKIINYRDSVPRILAKSANDPLQQATRITLNRTVDVANNIVGSAGLNPDVVAQLLANLYERAYYLALGFANNPSHITYTHSAPISDHFQRTSIAQFGYVYATLLWRMQATLVSDSAKAITLMKMVGYLGWDFNMDLRRREQGLKEVIADVYDLQNFDQSYQNILESFRRNQEPNTQDVVMLRVKVYRLWLSIPGRLQSAGVTVSKM